MLYTESFEGPAVVSAPRSSGILRRTWERLLNRYAGPRVDMGLSLGSSDVVLELPGGGLAQPARVAVAAGNGKVVALGQQAAAMEGREPEGVAVVRPIAGGVVVDFDRARRLLGSVLSACGHGILFGPRAVVAVPSDLSPVERQALVTTVRVAGARQVEVVDQALLAAVGAGLQVLEPRASLVINLGAGVAQTCVISLGHPVLSRGLRRCGDAMNDAIAEYVRRTHEVLVDDGVAELLKRDLGCAMPVDPPLTREVVGRHLTLGKPVRITLNSTEICSVLEPIVGSIAREIRQVLAGVSPQLLGDLIRRGAVLTGGVSKLRRLDEYLTRETRLEMHLAEDPETATARGLQAFLKDRRLRQTVLRPTAPKVTAAHTNARGWLVAALLAASSVLIIFSAQRQLKLGLPSPLDRLLDSGLTPAYSVASAPDFGAGLHQQTVALAAIKGERDRRLAMLATENRRLRRLLHGPVGFPGWMAANPAVARVIARDPRDWLSSLVLDVGTDDGVRQGAVVSARDGLVGRVVSVAGESCRVRLFTDSRAVVAATVPSRKAAGVVLGIGQRQVQMRYLDPDAGVKVGDRVQTSGLDGVFPEGIPVGRVVRLTGVSGDSQTVQVQPAVDFDTLHDVLVFRETTG